MDRAKAVCWVSSEIFPSMAREIGEARGFNNLWKSSMTTIVPLTVSICG